VGQFGVNRFFRRKAKQLATSFCEEHPVTNEEINCNLPMSLVEELAIISSVNLDHAHVKMTQCPVLQLACTKGSGMNIMKSTMLY